MTKSKYKIEDYRGTTINNWTILDYSHSDYKGQQFWICQCKCGLIKPVRTSHILRHLNKGCMICKRSLTMSDTLMWRGGKFIAKGMHTKSRFSALSRNLEFNITIEDMENQWILQEGICAYSGISLTLPLKSKDTNFTASLDRIDSSIGYVIGNIQWVLKEVNLMKMNLKENRFLELCRIITNNIN